MTEHISCDCKCKSNSTTCNSKQKWNNGNGILAHIFVRIVSISKGLLII